MLLWLKKIAALRGHSATLAQAAVRGKQEGRDPIKPPCTTTDGYLQTSTSTESVFRAQNKVVWMLLEAKTLCAEMPGPGPPVIGSAVHSARPRSIVADDVLESRSVISGG
ncbi:hypothetical protein DFH06DRAFT_1128519 [Mycena polygramma]|nr:hypothetical protein DFH06DRAFT_1128519 [Mycena polygramma]